MYAHLLCVHLLFLYVIRVVCGYGMCAVLMHGLVVSSVATVFVCFAHDDVALKNHRPVSDYHYTLLTTRYLVSRTQTHLGFSLSFLQSLSLSFLHSLSYAHCSLSFNTNLFQG